MKELTSNISTELTTELENIYKKHFKDSAITFNSGFFGKDTIFIDLYLANNKNELHYGYKENDMFNISFRLKNNELESLSKSYKITPTINTYLCYERTILKFRKVKGENEKIKRAFEKFVIELKEQIKRDFKNYLIHKDYVNLVIEKCINKEN